MKHLMTRLSALLLALLMLFGASGLAAEKLTPIEQLALDLQAAQSAYTQSVELLAEVDETLAALEKKYEKDQNNAKLQDQLIDTMIAREDAEDAYAAAFASLMLLQVEQTRLAIEAECEDWYVEYEGKFADLLVTVTVDENLIIYALTVEVDG